MKSADQGEDRAEGRLQWGNAPPAEPNSALRAVRGMRTNRFERNRGRMRVSGPREPSGQAWKQSFRVSGVQCPSKRLRLEGFLGVRVWIMYFSVSESFAAYKGRVSLRNEGTPLKAPRVGFRPPSASPGRCPGRHPRGVRRGLGPDPHSVSRPWSDRCPRVWCPWSRGPGGCGADPRGGVGEGHAAGRVGAVGRVQKYVGLCGGTEEALGPALQGIPACRAAGGVRGHGPARLRLRRGLQRPSAAGGGAWWRQGDVRPLSEAG